MNKENIESIAMQLLLVIVGLIALYYLIDDIVALVVSIVIWSFSGWAVGQILRRDYGIVHSALLGFSGGLVSYFVFRILNIDTGNIVIVSDVLAGIVGALLIIGVRAIADRM